MVAAVHHPEGCTSLLILPSESPSTRREALAVEALVVDFLAQPGAALLRCKIGSFRASVADDQHLSASFCQLSLPISTNGRMHGKAHPLFVEIDTLSSVLLFARVFLQIYCLIGSLASYSPEIGKALLPEDSQGHGRNHIAAKKPARRG